MNQFEPDLMGGRQFSLIETQDTISSGAQQNMSNHPPPLILPLTRESLDLLENQIGVTNGFFESMPSETSMVDMMNFEAHYDHVINDLFLNITKTRQQNMDSMHFMIGYYIPQRCEYNIKKLNNMMSYLNYTYDAENHILTSLETGLPVELNHEFFKELEETMKIIDSDARIIVVQYPNKYEQLFLIIREFNCRLGYFRKLCYQTKSDSLYEAMSDGYFLRKQLLRLTVENIKANLDLPDVLRTIREEDRFDKILHLIPDILNDLVHFLSGIQDVVELNEAQVMSLSNDLKNLFNEVWQTWHITKNYLMNTRRHFDLQIASERRFKKKRPDFRTAMAYEKESLRFSNAINHILEQGEAPEQQMPFPVTDETFPIDTV